MTELEKIERAKMYMDKLAQGINPLDGTRVPEKELVNQDRMSRCFSFVSEVLGQVIEHGGTASLASRKKSGTLPFSLSAEKRSTFAGSKDPIPVSELTKRLNELNDNGDMKKLSHRMITSWLLETGLLSQKILSSREEGKRPTPEGEKLGITVENRTGTRGMYQVVLYDARAQRFIVDNLDAITAYDQTRLEMQGQPWRLEDDARLKELYGQKVPIKKIARELRRSPSAILARLRMLEIDGE